MFGYEVKDDGNEIVIRISKNSKTQVSSTGKMQFLASSAGWSPAGVKDAQGHDLAIQMNLGYKV